MKRLLLFIGLALVLLTSVNCLSGSLTKSSTESLSANDDIAPENEQAFYVGTIMKIAHGIQGFPAYIYMDTVSKPIKVAEWMLVLPMGEMVKLTIEREDIGWIVKSVEIIE